MSGTVEEGDDGQGDLLDVLPAGTTLPSYELILGQGLSASPTGRAALPSTATSPSRNICRPTLALPTGRPVLLVVS
jgi:hypothetical protein